MHTKTGSSSLKSCELCDFNRKVIISDVLVLFCSGIGGDLVLFGHKIAPGVPSIGTFLLFVVIFLYMLPFLQ